MITLQKCEKILNINGKKYSEEEVKKIRAELYRLASVIDDVKKLEDENVGE